MLGYAKKCWSWFCGYDVSVVTEGCVWSINLRFQVRSYPPTYRSLIDVWLRSGRSSWSSAKCRVLCYVRFLENASMVQVTSSVPSSAAQTLTAHASRLRGVLAKTSLYVRGSGTADQQGSIRRLSVEPCSVQHHTSMNMRVKRIWGLTIPADVLLGTSNFVTIIRSETGSVT
jgi:hypothetical protein